MIRSIFILLLSLTVCGLSAQTPRLDKHHLLLDAGAGEGEKRDFVFTTFQEAVSHLGDSCTLYIAPGVYWVDDPDNPEIAVGKDGREPFGCVIRCRNLRLLGLDGDARNTVLASQRGQTQGAIGNFTMLDIWCDSLKVENLTLGNYCNVDLDYPLNPALSRKKRSDAITQAHVGYVHGKSLTAKNVRFISRLNLNPLNGAKESLYEDCHFECTKIGEPEVPLFYQFFVGGQSKMKYYDNVISFTGLNFVDRVVDHLAICKMAWQWNFYSIFYSTVSFDFGYMSDIYDKWFDGNSYVAGAGLTLGADTVIGPLEVSLMGSNINSAPVGFVNVGFWF